MFLLSVLESSFQFSAIRYAGRVLN